MEELADKELQPPAQVQNCLAPEDIDPLLQQIQSWELQAPGINKSFHFKEYLVGVEFVKQLALLADAENHHPKITIEWRKVSIGWWTHSLGGLHKNDFIMAAKTDKLAQSFYQK